MTPRPPATYGPVRRLLRWTGRRALPWTLAAAGLLALGYALRGPLPWRYYTDGLSIRQPAPHAVLRAVLWEEPLPLPGGINTQPDNFEPAITPDGRTMIFTRGRAKDNADLYVATWDGEAWSEPRALENLNTPADELGPALSPDGRYLFFYSDREGGLGGYDLWIARRDGDRWGAVLNPGPSVNSPYNEYDPALSPDGARLLFASNRPKIEPTEEERRAWKATLREARLQSDYDLFAAVLTPPPFDPKDISLPAAPELKPAARLDALNSDADEGQPAWTPRGDFLYFSSNRPGGRGGFDLYRARDWSGVFLPPENIGAPVNTAADDMDPALWMEGFSLVFSGNRDAEAPHLFRLYHSVSRDVMLRTDADLLALAWGRLGKAKWALLVLLLSLLALIWLVRRTRRSHSSLQRALFVSVLVHAMLAVLFSLWVLSEAIYQAAKAASMEVAIDTGALAREQLALDIREQVTELPSTEAVLPMAQEVMHLELPALETLVRDLEPVVPQVRVPEFTVAMASREETPAERAALDPFTPQVEVRPRTPQAAPVPMEQPKPARAESEPALKESTGELARQEQETPAPASVQVPATRPEEKLDATQPGGLAAEVAIPAPAVPAHASTPPTLAAAVARFEAATSPRTNRLAAVTLEERDARSSAAETATVAARDTMESKPLEAAGLTRSPRQGPPLELTPTLPELGQALRLNPPRTSDRPPQVLKLEGPGQTLRAERPERRVGLSEKMETAPHLEAIYLLRDPDKRRNLLGQIGATDETEAAVNRALDWFTRHQEEDGRWDIVKHGGSRGGHNVACTGLAMLCYMGWGATHTGAGPHQATVTRAKDWLLSQLKPDGDLRGPSGDMYDHGIAAIALTELYGLTRDPSLREPVERIMAFIIQAQHKTTGGWRYQPGDAGDTSVFGWQVMALTSARMAGLNIPEEAFQGAAKWLEKVGRGGAQGGFGYQDKGATPAMSAEALFCRQLMGVRREDPELEATARYIRTQLPDRNSPNIYYWYYGSLCLYQHQGEAWKEWEPRIREILVAGQERQGDQAGSWNPAGHLSGECGRAVTTALSTLTLEVYYRYLPLYGLHQGGDAAPRNAP